MARSRETKIELTAYDDLFQTDESREEAKLSKIRDIPISEIDEFPDHPFKVLMDEEKKDVETGNTIPYAGAGFQIYDPNGNLVTMTFTYPEVTTMPKVCSLRGRQALSGICVVTLPRRAMAFTPLGLILDHNGNLTNLRQTLIRSSILPSSMTCKRALNRTRSFLFLAVMRSE